MWPLAELQPVDPLSTPWTDWLAVNVDWLIALAAVATVVGVAVRHSPRLRRAVCVAWEWIGRPVVGFMGWRMRRAQRLSEIASAAEEVRRQVGSNGEATLHDHLAELRAEVRALRREVPDAIRRGLDDHEDSWHRNGKED